MGIRTIGEVWKDESDEGTRPWRVKWNGCIGVYATEELAIVDSKIAIESAAFAVKVLQDV